MRYTLTLQNLVNNTPITVPYIIRNTKKSTTSLSLGVLGGAEIRLFRDS